MNFESLITLVQKPGGYTYTLPTLNPPSSSVAARDVASPDGASARLGQLTINEVRNAQVSSLCQRCAGY